MKQKYLILFSLSGLILCCDLLTKQWARQNFAHSSPVEVIPSFLSLGYFRSPGFLFGFFHLPTPFHEVFFIGLPAFALILLTLIFVKLQENQWHASLALTSILGGAVGNLIDRIQYGYVVDFVRLQWGAGRTLPPFNLADLSILLGVGLISVHTFRKSEVP